MTIDLSKIGTGKTFTWTKEYLIKYLTTGKNPTTANPKIIAALRSIDRADFTPNNQKDKAYQDMEISLGFGETGTRPSVTVQMLELLEPKAGGIYLDIGTGSGYFAALLAFVAGQTGKVYTVERIQWIWELAREGAAKYPELRNIHFLYRDGMVGLQDYGPFDGIHIAFTMETQIEDLKKQLKVGGKLVCPTKNYDIRLIERTSEDEFIEEIIPGFVFDKGKEGVG